MHSQDDGRHRYTPVQAMPVSPAASSASGSPPPSCCAQLLRSLFSACCAQEPSPRAHNTPLRSVPGGPPGEERAAQYVYRPTATADPEPQVAGPSGTSRLVEAAIAATERALLLPTKSSESSAPLDRLRSAERTGSGKLNMTGVTVSETSTSNTAAGQQAGHASGRHQRNRSGADGKSHRAKGASGGSAAEMFATAGDIGDLFPPAPKPVLPGILLQQPQDDDEDMCPTCLDPYTTENPRIFTECGHAFHMQCIYEWLNRKDTCPMCESKMNCSGLLFE